MSEPTSARRYGTGGGDAYYDAVRYGGYKGTREQFGKDQAEFATNATAVAAAKEVVEQDTEEVRSTKETFVNTTVPDAITAIQQEGTTQVQAVTQQGEKSSQQVETVGIQWKDEVANEGRARVQAVEQAGTNQVQAVNDAGTAQVGAVNQAGADQVTAVEQAGTDQVQAVTDEGTTQVTAVEDAGAAERTAIEEKGKQTRESIPDDYTTLSDDVADLTRQLNDETTGLNSKAPVILETASGAIASFDDGADGMPVKKLVAQIEPVQDLHGQDSPYPAGGGKNVFPSFAETMTVNGVTFTANTDGTVTVNGTASDSIIYICSKTIPDSPGADYCKLSDIGINADTSYILSGTPSEGAYNYYLQLLVHGSGAEPKDTGSGSTPFSFTASEIAERWYRLAIRIDSGVTVNNVVFKPMIRLASEADATFAPYSNICPISGWTGAEVTRTGKNIFGGEALADAIVAKIPGAVKDEVNKTVSFTAASVSGKIIFDNFKPNTQYGIFIKKTSTFSNLAIRYTDGTTASVYEEFLLSQNKTIDCVVGIWLSGTAVLKYDECGFVEGALTADDFIPYTGNQISVTFPFAAGTVYGGTLDVISGVLTVDRAMGDLGAMQWKKVSTTSRHWRFYATLNSQKFPSILLCSQYHQVGASEQYMGAQGIANQQAVNNILIMVCDERYSDVAAFQTAMSGVQVVYELATPQTYQLTAEQVSGILTTLYGTNNIWADTGDVEVTYPADTKLYIDGKLAEIQATILENIGG